MVLDILDLIGGTPLVELRSCSPRPAVRLFAKLEGQNPGGSVKDRIVLHMLTSARARGRLLPGQEIVEATTGNTGIALAMVGKRLGHPVRVVVPDSVSPDLAQAIRAWDAEIEWVPADLGIKSAIIAAREIANKEDAFLLDQFGSPENPRCHYETTAVEILADLPEIDAFVCGLGTSGTAMGVSRRLKEHNPLIQVIAAEPHPGHHLQGLRSLDEGYVPPILDLGLLDSKLLVSASNAFRAGRELLRREGILGGLSSGAVLHAALKWAANVERANIVMLFADSGWKYLKSPAFDLDLPLEGEVESFDDVVWW